MNNHWRDHLQARSAHIDETGQACFPSAPAEANLALCDLSHLGLIWVAGVDAATFLQGQLTNDVRLVTEIRSQLSGYCTPKGRLLASFRLFRLADSYYLHLPRTQLDFILQRLRLYVLRAKVSLADASNDLAGLGLSGDEAMALLGGIFSSVPAQPNDLFRQGELTLMRLPGPGPRFQVLGPPSALIPVWDRLAERSTLVNAPYWTLLDIRAGLPTIHPETREAFVPQMVNMQLIDGVSFSKGCYTGQEVVARMQYLATLKRRLYLGEVVSQRPPAPGDEVFSPVSTSPQTTGTILEAVSVGGDRYELSLVLETSAFTDDRVSLGAEGPRLELREPPYGLPAG